MDACVGFGKSAALEEVLMLYSKFDYESRGRSVRRDIQMMPLYNLEQSSQNE